MNIFCNGGNCLTWETYFSYLRIIVTRPLTFEREIFPINGNFVNEQVGYSMGRLRCETFTVPVKAEAYLWEK